MSYSESQEFFKDMVFCPTCNYELGKTAWSSAVISFACHSCELAHTDTFYHWGSRYHKHAYELWCRSCDADLKWPSYYHRPPMYIDNPQEEACV